jgi:osmoprotectant transport system substrate-binding protein
MRIPRSILAGGLVLSALTVSSCGADQHSKTTAASTPKTTSARVLPGVGKPPVTIGDKNFTEQFLLGELYAQALTAQGYSVQLNRDIGPTEVTMRAIYSGRLDMYPEYVGTWNTAVAGLKPSFKTARGAYLAACRYARLHGLELLAPTPFSDTGGLAVTVSYRSAHALRTIADLRKVAQTLTLGAPPQFQQSAAGLGALEQSYGFVPATLKPLAIGGQYQALDHRIVQAAEVNTTDGQLDTGNYALLADPRKVFGWGQAVPVVPAAVLRVEGPAFAATVDRVSKLLTVAAIRQLNAAVDIYGQDPALAAKEFLQAHGLVALTTS